MAVQLERHLFNLEEYERMIEAGIFAEDARLELIRGEIIEMTPINYPHAACVARLTNLFRTVTEAYIWPQNNPLRIADHSRPEPDLTLLRWRDDWYAQQPPQIADVLLVIEVADSSLKYDRGVMGTLYAEAGIPAYWIVDLREQVVEMHAEPAAGGYRQTRQAQRGETLALPGGLSGAVAVSAILGAPGAG